LYAAILARLASPHFLLDVASGDEKPLLGWFKRFDGAPFTPPDIDPEVPEKDRPRGRARDGIFAVGSPERVAVTVRPGALTDGAREEIDRLVALDDNWTDTDPWRALQLLRSPGVAALVADPTPGWPQDPRRSAPELLPEVAATLGLDPDTAVLYLQLLALPNPTKANVLAWNTWKPALYTRATVVLLEKKLVVEAKRARAGRDHFLPGGWHEQKSGSLPMEEWKLRHYGGEDPPLHEWVPLEPFAATFRAAWARVRAGDAPRYEKRR
jgi:hypothetical protein